MNLSNDIARCDGLLPKNTQIDGKPMILWAIDCPKREQCARYQQIWRDDPAKVMPFTAHFHGPSDSCPDFIEEN